MLSEMLTAICREETTRDDSGSPLGSDRPSVRRGKAPGLRARYLTAAGGRPRASNRRLTSRMAGSSSASSHESQAGHGLFEAIAGAALSNAALSTSSWRAPPHSPQRASTTTEAIGGSSSGLPTDSSSQV